MGVRHGVAGAALGINPFDEPNVSEAKDKTKALLGTLQSSGTAARNPLRPHRPARWTSSAPASRAAHLRPSSERRSRRWRPLTTWRFSPTCPPMPTSRRRLGTSAPGFEAAIALRPPSASALDTSTRPANTTRADPIRPLAFVLTGRMPPSTEIPDVGYTFSVLKRAQALGDAETLEAHDRRTVPDRDQRRGARGGDR